MQRFQLLIREPGKEPRHVPLTGTMTVGRSRRTDIHVADLEVGREQFRVGCEGQLVFVEGIGQTNRTTVDGVDLPPGERRLLSPNSLVRVGKTSFELLISPDSAVFSTSELPGRTMVAKGPGVRPAPSAPPPVPPPPPTPPPAPPPAPTPTPAAQEPTDGGGPMQTMRMSRPGPGLRGMPPANTTPPPGPVPPAPVPPPRPPHADNPPILNSRPGGAGAPPPSSSPPPAARAATTPPSPPIPPTPPSPPTPPPVEPVAARTAPPAPAPRATPKPSPLPDRPMTVALNPKAYAEAIGDASGIDLEARLHEEMPRLMVKSEGIRRRIRLLKPVTSVGRAESADVLLPIESVSEHHAELVFDGATWLVRDLGSTNGCLVDGALLRGDQAPMNRHTLVGFGAARAVFLRNDKQRAAADLREEQRAVKLLVQMGRLGRSEAQEAIRIVRSDPTQSLAEILLMDTPLQPGEWTTAVASARRQRGLLDGLGQFFAGLFRRKPKRLAP